MKVLVVGRTALFEELQHKLGVSHGYTHVEAIEDLPESMETDVVVDFTTDESPDNLAAILSKTRAQIYFLSMVKSSLTEMSFYLGELPDNLLGFNAWPGFVGRDIWEVTSLAKTLPEIPEGLDMQLRRVEDRVGMVSARVICMIINEAYYTVLEGTASRSDIDKGMKLGTGYPYGPFEWAGLIGLSNVYELLEAMWEDTHEERYKICPLLKKEYMALFIRN